MLTKTRPTFQDGDGKLGVSSEPRPHLYKYMLIYANLVRITHYSGKRRCVYCASGNYAHLCTYGGCGLNLACPPKKKKVLLQSTLCCHMVHILTGHVIVSEVVTLSSPCFICSSPGFEPGSYCRTRTSDHQSSSPALNR